MLPLGAQGANQAIEDAGALGALLSDCESAAQIPSRLDCYERVRRLRASRVQTLSKVRLGREKDVGVELRRYADPPNSGTATLLPDLVFCSESDHRTDVPTSFAERYRHDYGYLSYESVSIMGMY
jgi:salicylate hydroxylase